MVELTIALMSLKVEKMITLNQCKNNRYVYSIAISNLRYNDDCFIIIEKILKKYLRNEEIFLGFYRTDGMFMSKENFKKAQKTLSTFFEKHCVVNVHNKYLKTAKIPIIPDFFKILPTILDYFSDTVIIQSNHNWETFNSFFQNYLNHREFDIVCEGLADIEFFYSDSGDFRIVVNTQKYNRDELVEFLDSIISI